MKTWMMIGMMAALAGSSAVRAEQRDPVAGHWYGLVERDGWSQPLSLDIDHENGTYRGEWRSNVEVPSQRLESVAVQGNDVSFDTNKLHFAGRLNGDILSGTVTRKGSDATVGEFSITQNPVPEYNPGSEWSAPLP